MVRDRLPEIRQKAGLTKEALGAKLGKSRVQILRIENGQSSTPIETVEGWADACEHDLVLLSRRAPEAAALGAELAQASPEDRAAVLRLLRLLQRIKDPRERRHLERYLETTEAELVAADRDQVRTG